VKREKKENLESIKSEGLLVKEETVKGDDLEDDLEDDLDFDLDDWGGGGEEEDYSSGQEDVLVSIYIQV
jgi:hypothetical protein